uniref:ARAD1C07414p n=1 Tax=Blastobotrys adeninivorans TaxID=409370 RepID=A0A060SZG0_BLAAD
MSWVEKETKVVRGLVEADVEDLVYAARRDVEWIQEYLGQIDGEVDMTSLLKTPARIKTAMSPRKLARMTPANSPSKVHAERVKQIMQSPGLRSHNDTHVHFNEPISNSSQQSQDSSVTDSTQPSSIKESTRSSETTNETKSNTSNSSVQSSNVFGSVPDLSFASHSTTRNDELLKPVEQAEKPEEGDRHQSRSSKRKSSDFGFNATKKPKTPLSSDIKYPSLRSESSNENMDAPVTVTKSSTEVVNDYSSAKTPGTSSAQQPGHNTAISAQSNPRSVGHHHALFNSDDDEPPPTTKSSFGFSALPAKPPLSKRSLAKTPSVSGTHSGVRTSTVDKTSQWRKDPVTFQSKLQSSTGEQHSSSKSSQSSSERISAYYPKIDRESSAWSLSTVEADDNKGAERSPQETEEPEERQDEKGDQDDRASKRQDPVEFVPPARMSVHYPKIESVTDEKSKDGKSNIEKTDGQADREREKSHLEHKEPELPSVLRSPVLKSPVLKSPVRQPSSARSPTQPTVSRVPSNASTRLPSPTRTQSLKRDGVEKPQASPGSFISGVFKRAKQFLFDENAQQQGDPKKQEKQGEQAQEAPRTLSKQDTFSRLMAPTASSSRRAAASPAQKAAHQAVQQSPLAEKRTRMYPDLKQTQLKKPADNTKKANPPPSTANKQSSDGAKKDDKATTVEPIQHDEKTQDKGAKTSTSAGTGTVTKSASQSSKPISLAKQPLQAKASKTGKPMTIKINMAAQRDAEEKRKAAAVAAANSASATTSTVPNSPLPPPPSSQLPVPNSQQKKQFKVPISIGATTEKRVAENGSKLKVATSASYNPEDEKTAVKRTSDQLDSPLRGRTVKKPAPTLMKKPSSSSIGQTSGHGQQQPQSLMKTAMLHQHAKANPSVPHVEGVKFANDKIKFATASTSNSSGHSSSSTGVKVIKPQIAAASTALSSTSSASSSSASYNTPTIKMATPKRSGDDIVLPEIMSESEDDDEGNVLEEWANSPELQSLLKRQQSIDPDSIFGPIAPLKIEEVFKNSSRVSRFRPRSSSAVWSKDKLSQQEIEQYANQMGYKR